jgi:hypothetical protein
VRRQTIRPWKLQREVALKGKPKRINPPEPFANVVPTGERQAHQL